MIIDSLNGFERYFFVHKNFEKAYRFLKSHNLERIEEGRHIIDNDDVFAIVALEHGKDPDDAPLEAHDSHIDIQVLISGEETMGWKDRAACNSETAIYNEAEDIVYFDDEPNVFFTVEPMHVVVFFPHDAHAPLIGDQSIKKIVIKVRV